MKMNRKPLREHVLKTKNDAWYERDNAALQQAMTPRVITTEQQLQTVSDKFHYEAYTLTNIDIQIGYKIAESRDYIDGNCTYVPMMMDDDLKKQFGDGYKTILYIFATDKYVCKRISKLIRTKLVWEPYTHHEISNHTAKATA